MGTAYKMRCVDLTKENLGEKLDMVVTPLQTLLAVGRTAAWLGFVLPALPPPCRTVLPGSSLA